MSLSYRAFMKTLPEMVIPALPPALQGIKTRQPWPSLIQFHFGEPYLHYEVNRARYRPGLEIGFHNESRDRKLNRFLLKGFRQNLFEIKDTLGESIEAEMWDRGWTKIYEVYPEGKLDEVYQAAVGRRLVEFINCLHPIYVDLRSQVARIHR